MVEAAMKFLASRQSHASPVRLALILLVVAAFACSGLPLPGATGRPTTTATAGSEATARANATTKGFSEPLFSKTVQPGEDSLNLLYAHYAEIGSQEQAVLAAADTLQTQVQTAFARPGGTGDRLAAPAPGQAAGLKDAFLGFFGYARDTGKRARDRIIQISAGLSPGDKADAFDALRAGFKGDAQNFDDLLTELASGKLDNQAAQMESDLRNSASFAAAAQQANATVGEVVK